MAYQTEAQKKLDKKSKADAKGVAVKAAKLAKAIKAAVAVKPSGVSPSAPRKGPKRSPPRGNPALPAEVTAEMKKVIVSTLASMPENVIQGGTVIEFYHPPILPAEPVGTIHADGSKVEIHNGVPTLMVPTGVMVPQQNFQRELMVPMGDLGAAAIEHRGYPAPDKTLALLGKPCVFAFPAYFYDGLKELEEWRGRYHASVVPERLIGYAIDLLLIQDEASGFKAMELFRQRFTTSFMASTAQGLIPGPVTKDGQMKDAKKIEALAAFIDKQGNTGKAAEMRARAEEIKTADVEALQFLPKQELDLSALTKDQQGILTVIRDLGGAITADMLRTASPDDIKTLLQLGHLVNPREGVYRLDERQLAKKVQPVLKGVKKAKAPKPEKPPKEAKAPRPPKAPKVVDPNAPPRPPRKTGEVVNPTGFCLCGCAIVCLPTSRFKPGHDAKLHGAIVKAARAKDTDRPAMLKALPMSNTTTVAYLKQAPWMTAEVAAAVGIA